MEYLFNYTQELTSKIVSLCEDIVVIQRILTERKRSVKGEEKLKMVEREIKKHLTFLRILEHISYLEEVKNDIIRAIESLDAFLKNKSYTDTERKKIAYQLKSIAVPFLDGEEKKVATLSLQVQCIGMLEETLKIVEEIVLSLYGLLPPKKNLEEDLVCSVERLFTLKLEDLSNDEKKLLEQFFTFIQEAFKDKGLQGWEQAYIHCTEKLNAFKILNGLEPSSYLEITSEEVEESKDEEDEEEED